MLKLNLTVIYNFQIFQKFLLPVFHQTHDWSNCLVKKNERTRKTFKLGSSMILSKIEKEETIQGVPPRWTAPASFEKIQVFTQ
jgi:hypothetical protein